MRVYRYIILFVLFSTMSFNVSLVFAHPQETEKILLLFKERDPDHKGIVQLFSDFLQQVGYSFDSRDIETLLVEQPDLSSYTGIMTCYQTSQMVGGDLYPAWLVKQMEAGRRILIIGSYGAYQGMIRSADGSLLEWNESTRTINTFFYPFGLEFYFAFTSDQNKLKLLHADKDYAQFEEPLTTADLRYYQLYKSVNPANRIFFEMKRTDMIDSRSAVNVITPFGGMILEGYSYFWDSEKQKTIFRVNFPAFIKEVFEAESPPVYKYAIRTHAELLTENPLPQKPPPSVTESLKPGELSRRILIPYKIGETPDIEEHPLYQRAAVVLEYLGMIPIYWPVEDGLPDDRFMASFRGIVSWHTKPEMVQAKQYGEWLLRQIKQGRRVVILQEYGATIDMETKEPVANQAEVMRALGIDFVYSDKREISDRPEIKIADKEFLGFEKELTPSLISFKHLYRSAKPENTVFFSLHDTSLGNIDLGVISTNGGVCLGNTPFYFPSRDAKHIGLIKKALKGEIAPEVAEKPTLGAWILNPYRFFSAALGLDNSLSPDITTLNGSRIFYAHIDGDALESVSLIDGAHLAGFYVYEKILKKFKEIPTSVSVITKFIESLGNDYYHPTVELARKIFALPNVDMAVHAATHPFDWIGGDPYIVNPESYPYRIGYRPQNLLEEIWGAKLFADHNLAPADKKVSTIFWTGATNPDQKALDIVWRAGLHNLNGGDPRFDDEYPSIAGVSPYSKPYLPYRQYLTSAQNDYIYSLYLTGDWGGQKKVINHFDRTNKPYRFYPMNLYYHFYGGIKNESLEALDYIYDYVRTMDAAPIFASQYCQIVEDFYQTRIGKEGQAFWVENNGFLRTVRFSREVNIDIDRSEGVLGYSYHEGQTYIHLDGSRHRRILLADTTPDVPYFIQATQHVDQRSYDGTHLRFIYRGFGKAFIKVGGLLAATPYQVTLSAPDREPVSSMLTTDQGGLLEFRALLPAPAAIYQGVITAKGGSGN